MDRGLDDPRLFENLLNAVEEMGAQEVRRETGVDICRESEENHPLLNWDFGFS